MKWFWLLLLLGCSCIEAIPIDKTAPVTCYYNGWAVFVGRVTFVGEGLEGLEEQLEGQWNLCGGAGNGVRCLINSLPPLAPQAYEPYDDRPDDALESLDRTKLDGRKLR